MMTYSEKGLFIDMLSRCFNEGGLPADVNKLLRLFKCDKDDLQECLQMFYIKDEKLFNKKLDSIQKDQRKISAKRSEAGKISAEKRKAKRLITSTSVEQVLDYVATNPQQNSTSTVQQNRTEHNKTLEERKEEFKDSVKSKWLNLGGSDYLLEAEAHKFFFYWSEHGETDNKMRFEKEKSFGIGRRLGTWKGNNQPAAKAFTP